MNCRQLRNDSGVPDRELAQTRGYLQRKLAPTRILRVRIKIAPHPRAASQNNLMFRCTDERRLRSRWSRLYFQCVLCRDRRHAQTFALSLNDDHGGAAESRRACPPRSGKPEGSQASPLEPTVQGRFRRHRHGGGCIYFLQACARAQLRTCRELPRARSRYARRVRVFGASLSASFPDMSQDRNSLRRQLREARRAIPAAQRIAAAEALARRLLTLPFAPEAGHVAGYWAMDGEIALHAWQLQLPATLIYCLPVLHEDGCLRFAPWRAGEALVANRYGIPDRKGGARALPASEMHWSDPVGGFRRQRATPGRAPVGTIAASRRRQGAARRGWSAPLSPRSRSRHLPPSPGTSRSTRSAPIRTFSHHLCSIDTAPA